MWEWWAAKEFRNERRGAYCAIHWVCSDWQSKRDSSSASITRAGLARFTESVLRERNDIAFIMSREHTDSDA
jgi:hypothetical protein